MARRRLSPRTRVLIVDSHDDTRALYTQFLTAFGFGVVGVATTDEALERIHQAAVVVTELAVSGSFDGIALIERIRADREWSLTPIVVVSALAFPDDQRRALEAGATVFLSKPCEPEALRAELARVLATGHEARPAPAPDRPHARRRVS